MPPIEIREATQGDLGALLEMMQAFNEFERIRWTREAGEAPLRTLLSDPSLGVVGMVEGETGPLGYFIVTWGFDLEWNGRDAILTELFLVPEARDRGLGSVVLAEAEALAVRGGAHALHLMVRSENERAHRLYRRAGYVSPPRVFLTKRLGARQPSVS